METSESLCYDPLSKNTQKRQVMRQFTLVLCLMISWATLSGSPNINKDLEPFRTIQGPLDIAGGTAHIPIMMDAIQKIKSVNPKVRIHVSGGGSGVGVEKLAAGLTQIGNTGRELTRDEMTRYKLVSHAIAIDGIALVVHPSSPLVALNTETAKRVFLGEIKDWQPLTGEKHAIHLYVRDEASGTRETVATKLLEGKNLAPATAHTLTSNGAMKAAVAKDRWAIGYLSIGHLDKSVTGLKLDGVMPTQDLTRRQIYPLSRRLYVNTRQNPDVMTQAFVKFLLSNTGTKIVQEHGFIPIGE